LGIFLLSNIGGLPIKLLKSEAELERVILIPLRQLQMRNQLLHLMHHIVINFFALIFLDLFLLAIIDAHQIVSEGWDHEELLHHTVHVADAAEVA